jgi:hypothetical protein
MPAINIPVESNASEASGVEITATRRGVLGEPIEIRLEAETVKPHGQKG